MWKSDEILITQSTLAGESMVFQNQCSLIGVIQPEHEKSLDHMMYYQNFKSILPMNKVDLIRYLICLCEQIVEIQKRQIKIELLSLNNLRVMPKNNSCYLFFFRLQNISQDFLQNIKTILYQLNIDGCIYNESKNLQDILYNLIRLSDDQFKKFSNSQIKKQLEMFANSCRYASEKLNLTCLDYKNAKEILYSNNDELSLFIHILLIQKPCFIQYSNQDIVIKISRQNHDEYLRQITILESFQDDINYKYLGYFRFETLTITFYKQYYQTFDIFIQQMRSKLAENPNTLQLIQQIIKKAFISLIQQLELLHTNYCIVHRDLKPKNIMIDPKNELNQLEDYLDLNCVIIDFDCSIQIQQYVEQIHKTFGGGSSYYIPPEYDQIDKYDSSYDVYQLGVIFWKTLFNIEDKYFNDGLWKNPDELQKANSFLVIKDNLRNMLIKMVSEKPNDRPSLINLEKNLRCNL